MARFENKELGFDVPEGWEDRSVVSFEAPRPPGKMVGPNVTLMRIGKPRDQTLPAFATQQVASLAASLPKFELVEQRNITLGAANETPAVQVLFHWQHPDGALTQRVTMFVRGENVWSFAATSLRGDLEQTNALFDSILRSFRIHPVGNVAAPYPASAPYSAPAPSAPMSSPPRLPDPLPPPPFGSKPPRRY